LKKIIYLCRTFSGLTESISNGIWVPSGAPTVFRVIERMASSRCDLELMLFDEYASNLIPKKIKLEGLDCTVWIVGSNFLLKKNLLLNHTWRILCICILILKRRPDLLYVDKSNLVVAALFARFSVIKVVWRVMGIYPDMWSWIDGHYLRFKLIRLALRSSFDVVICTKDGTNGAEWMNEALRPSVPRHWWLNGVERWPQESNPLDYFRNFPILKQDNKFLIGFVGRLESIKGIKDFIRAIEVVVEQIDCEAIVVGKGSLEHEVQNYVKARSLPVRFLKNVPNSAMRGILNQLDLYVSCNRLGNLSNANLEAFDAAIPMLIPKPPEGQDLDSDLLDSSQVYYYDREGSLEQRLVSLIGCLDQNIKAKRPRLQRWDERVEQEMKLLSKVLGAKI